MSRSQISSPRMLGLFLLSVAAAVIVGCANENVAGHLGDAQLLEVQEAEYEASVMVPAVASASAGWTEIGPGVWLQVERDQDQAVVTEHIVASGTEALTWLREVYYPQSLVELRLALAAAKTDARRAMYRDRIASAERFLRATDGVDEHDASDTPEPLSCTSSAAASAMKTSGSPGAKAYANARNCSYFNDGFVDTSAFAGGSQDSQYQDVSGYNVYRSVSAVAYGPAGTDCYSRGTALAYPFQFQERTYDKKCAL